MKKSTRLRDAIRERRAVVVPGCHDALSAKVIASCGFEAVQISGFGVAGSLMAQPDVGLVQMKDILDVTWNIVQAVDIPVMADADTGGGNAINAEWVTERLISMGAAGMNIEDQVFPKRCGHMAGKEVISAEEMVGKIRACVEIRNHLEPDFVINARTDSFATHGLDEAIRRGNLYLQAGADLVFIDAIASRADITRAVAALDGPLSVNLMDGVTGVKTELIPPAHSRERHSGCPSSMTILGLLVFPPTNARNMSFSCAKKRRRVTVRRGGGDLRYYIVDGPVS